MATWSLTKAEIQRQIETLIRRLTGKTTLTSLEVKTVEDSINEAIIDVSTERSVKVPQYLTTDTTATMTADQNYTDLSTGVVSVVDGSVRIAAEDRLLTRIDYEDFIGIDPGEDVTGLPSYYSTFHTGTTLRMLWRCTPDSAYVAGLSVVTIPDEDSISSIPQWMHPLVRSLANALSLEYLGLPSAVYRAQYEERLKNMRQLQKGFTGPEHLRRRNARPSGYVASELRRPT
jgi:hypothetical protein